MLRKRGEQHREAEAEAAVSEVEGEAFHGKDGGAACGIGLAVQGAAHRETEEAERGHQQHGGREAPARMCRDDADQADQRHTGDDAKTRERSEALVHFRGDGRHHITKQPERRTDETEAPFRQFDEAVVAAVDRGEIPHHAIDGHADHDDDKRGGVRENPLRRREGEFHRTAAGFTQRIMTSLLRLDHSQRDHQA